MSALALGTSAHLKAKAEALLVLTQELNEQLRAAELYRLRVDTHTLELVHLALSEQVRNQGTRS